MNSLLALDCLILTSVNSIGFMGYENINKLFWLFSSTYFWLPLFLFIIISLFICIKRNYNNYYLVYLYFILFLSLTLFLTDFVSSSIFKPFFARLRPSHEPLLMDILWLYPIDFDSFYKGGSFGFFSAHAANSFGSAFFLFFSFFKHNFSRNYFIAMFVYAFLTSFSRIYLGVHYLSDILGGILFSFFIAYGTSLAFKRFVKPYII